MLNIEKSKTAKLLALSFMLNFTVVQPVCSTITYAATRDSDYHTIENSTSKKIQSSREYLYTPYKSNAERQAEAEAIRQQQAEAEAQRRATQEALQQSEQSSGSPSGSTYNYDGTVKELGDGDSNLQQAKERLQQMMKNHPPTKSNYSAPEEKNVDSLSTRVSNQLSEKDKEVLLNTSKSDAFDEKYISMAKEVCKASGLSDKECTNSELQKNIQNCLWGELSHVEASGQEYENAKKTAMDTCVYVLRSEQAGEGPEKGSFWSGLKSVYDNINKSYEDNVPDAVKFVLGDNIAEAGLTVGLTALSFASFGISTGALATLRAAKAGTKLASKADKMAGLVGKSPNLSGKFASTLSNDTKAALNLTNDAVFKELSGKALQEAQLLRMNGYGVKKASSVAELAEAAYGEGSASAKLLEKAVENAAKNEKKIHFNVLERTSSNYAKVIGADLVGAKAINTAGAGDAINSKIQNSEYNVTEVNKALENEEFAKLLESKRSDAEVTRIAKAVSTSTNNANRDLAISQQVERNLAGLNAGEEGEDGKVAEKIAEKAGHTRSVSQKVGNYVTAHPRKISDGLKDLGVTPEEIKQYQK